MIFPSQVEFVGFDDEQRRGLVIEKKVIISFDQILEILLGNVPIERRAVSGDPSGQGRGSDLQIDDEIGFGNPFGKNPVNLVVNDKFVVRKRLISVNFILFKYIVAENPFLEEFALDKPGLLMISVDQENELGKKCSPFLLVVEILEIGVVGLVLDDFSTHPLSQ